MQNKNDWRVLCFKLGAAADKVAEIVFSSCVQCLFCAVKAVFYPGL